MKRIIYHWTAGTNFPNDTDLLHYHYVIDDKGRIHQGVFSVKDNENCLDEVYAAHTGGGNTGSIGIAFAGMKGYTSVFNVGRYPLTQVQLEAGWKLGAELVKQYDLDIKDKETIQTHYGFAQRNPKSLSAGKIDITFLPSMPNVQRNEIEDLFREKVLWYMDKV